jgi:hypothetical protein
VAGRSPVDRGKGGLKRSLLTDGAGIPLHPVSAGANQPDAPLLRPTLAGLDRLDGLPEEVTVHLDGAYTGSPTAALLAELGFTGAIARKGVPAPVQVGPRWVVERTHAWMNGYGKLRRCTERRRLLDRPQRAERAPVAGLAAALPSGRGGFRSHWRLGRIRRGRTRGIGRSLAEPGFQLLDALVQRRILHTQGGVLPPERRYLLHGRC